MTRCLGRPGVPPVSTLPLVLLLCVSAPVALSVPADPAQAAANMPSSQDLASFFPSLNNDLTKVTWAHAVNSQAELEDALKNESIMMLEADVILGKTNASQEVVPVMGHPPATESDLSLKQFLETVVEYNRNHSATHRGIKLDFKSIEVYERGLGVLKETFEGVPAFPVWLNADILPGPVNSAVTPVNAKAFLDRAKADHPQLTLSLGWTTAWGSKVANQSAAVNQAMYNEKNVDDMLAALNESSIDQPITYAVRAAFVAHSLDQLKNLLQKTKGNATLTVWSSDKDDLVDAKSLRKNILDIGKNRVYLDVGEALEKELDLKSGAVATYASIATVATALFVFLLRGL